MRKIEEVPKKYLEYYLKFIPVDWKTGINGSIAYYNMSLYLGIVWLRIIDASSIYSFLLKLMIVFMCIFSIGTIAILLNKNKFRLYYLHKGLINTINSLLFLIIAIKIPCVCFGVNIRYLKESYILIYILFLIFPTYVNAYLLKNGYYYKLSKKENKKYTVIIKISIVVVLISIIVFCVEVINKDLLLSIAVFEGSLIFELGIHSIYKYYVIKKINYNPFDFYDYKTKKIDDKDALNMINEIFINKGIDEFKKIDENLLHEHFNALRKKGMSMKQISKLTGLSYYRVKKICNKTIFELDDNMKK